MRDMEDGPSVILSRRHEPTAVVKAVTFDDDDVASGDEDSDAEFEFPFVSREPSAGPAADELFTGGRIRAFYPVFGRVLDEPPAPAPAPAPAHQRPRLGRLFQLEQARTSSVASTSSSASSSSSSTADLDGASPDSYCLWTPGSSSSAASSPSRPPRKSGSTGSVARWRRIGELVVGRSHSDGKEKFLFLSAPSSPARDMDRDHSSSSPASSKSKPKQPPPLPPKGSKAANKASTGGGGGRRTFLPYRQELGLFASLHGLSRNHHPY